MRSAAIDGRLEAIAGVPLAQLTGPGRRYFDLIEGGSSTVYCAFTAGLPSSSWAAICRLDPDDPEAHRQLALRYRNTTLGTDLQSSQGGGGVNYRYPGDAVEGLNIYAFGFRGDLLWSQRAGTGETIQPSDGVAPGPSSLFLAPGPAAHTPLFAAIYPDAHDERTRALIYHWLARRFSLLGLRLSDLELVA